MFTILVRVMLFPITKVLYFNISTFQRMCAVLSMAVFCSSLISCTGYIFNYSGKARIAPIIIWISLNFTFKHAGLLFSLLKSFWLYYYYYYYYNFVLLVRQMLTIPVFATGFIKTNFL
jgi:hypothetical protein